MITLKPDVVSKTAVCLDCRTGKRVPQYQAVKGRCACGGELHDLGDVRIPKKRDKSGWAVMAELVRQGLRLYRGHITWLRNRGKNLGIILGALDSPQAVRDFARVNRLVGDDRRAGARAALNGNLAGASSAEHYRLQDQERKNDRLRRRLVKGDCP